LGVAVDPSSPQATHAQTKTGTHTSAHEFQEIKGQPYAAKISMPPPLNAEPIPARAQQRDGVADDDK
jgi:hypothetical protein